MSTESLGTARLDIAVDLAQMHAAIGQAKTLTSGLSSETQQAFQQSNQTAKSATETLLRYQQTIGKTADEVKLMRAVWRGVSTDVVKEIASMISAQRQLAESNMAQKKADENNFLREQQRVVQALTQRFHELEAAEAQAARGNQFVASLQQQAFAAGKTRAELLELQAAELGVARAAAPFIAKLKESEAAAHRGATAFNQYGLSVKQTQAAMRQVPAQITDIVVSLQGGQNPLTVLLQQGGQLRDVFGGVRPAVTALGNALRGLINPYTLAAAAVAGLGYAFYTTEQQTENLTRSLIMSGRQAEISTDQMKEIARGFDNLKGVTANRAVSVLAEVAANGRIASENIDLVAKAAIEMEKLSGKAVKDTIAQFADLAKDPVGASLRLTEQMNYLTLETLESMQAALDQGDATRAAQIAQEAFADTIATRGAEMRNNLGLISSMFLNIKENAGEAWDGVVQGMSRVEEKAKTMMAAFFNADPTGNNGFTGLAQLTAAEGLNFFSYGLLDPTALGAKTPGVEAPKPPAPTVDPIYAQTWKTQVEANRSRLEKQKIEVAQIREAGKALGQDAKDIDKLIAASWARYNEGQKKGDSTRGIDNASMRDALQGFKDQLAQEQAAIQNSRSVLQAEYGAKLVTLEDYYARQRELLERDASAQETALQGQIAVLRGRNATGKDAIDVQRQLGQLETQLANVRAKSVADGQVLAIQEKQNIDARTAAIEDYVRAQDMATLATEQQWQASVDSVSQGTQEFAQTQRLIAITRKYSEELARLALLKARNPAEAAQYDAQIQAAQRAMDSQVAATREGYAQMLEAQSMWQNGVTKGWADWAEQAKNVAGQISQVTTSSLDRLVDAFGEFAKTGKFQWKSMLADMLAELAKFLAKQAVMQWVQLGVSLFTGGATTATGASSSYSLNSSGGAMDAAPFAKGAAFSNSPSLSAYSNQVHNTPQPFYFAKGAGVFGEAGWEGIFPLHRGSDGNLGVRAAGGGSANTISIVVSTVVNSDGSATTDATTEGEKAELFREFSEQMRAVAHEELQTSMMQGGLLWRAGVGVGA